MKNIISTGIFCLLLITSYAQSGKKFEYQTIEFGSILITPTFDQSKGQGKLGMADFLDKNYANNLIYDIIKGVLPKEKLLKIHLNSAYTVFFSKSGDVINCTFTLNPADIGLISEEDLLNLYTKFKKTKIDMNKIKIRGGNDAPSGETYDYSILVGSLVPFEYRNDPRLKK